VAGGHGPRYPSP